MTKYTSLSIAALVLFEVGACGGSEPLSSALGGSMGGSGGASRGTTGGGGSGGASTGGRSTSSGGSGGSVGSGGSGGSIGSGGSGGSTGSGGVVGSGGSGGSIGSGVVVGSGGSGTFSSAGGAIGSGGASVTGTGVSTSTGGIRGSGGVSGTGGTTATFSPDGSFGDSTPSGGSGGTGAGGAAIDAPAPAACSGSYVRANGLSNYAFKSTLGLPAVSVASGADLTFDWSGVTTDMRGRPIDPKQDINLIAVTMWQLTLTELQAKVNADALVQRDLVVVPFSLYSDGSSTSAKLSDFTLLGVVIPRATLLSYFDIAAYPAANHVYLAIAETGTTLGQGVRMTQAFQLDAASTNTTVKLTSTSTQTTYAANLHDLVPLGIPAGQAGITFDWSAVQTNALGNVFDPSAITDILVGHYQQGLTELEGRFMELDAIATELYRGTIVSGTSFALSTLKDSAGKSFAGIDGTGTWLVALTCGSCRNPAPWYLSRLVPCQ